MAPKPPAVDLPRWLMTKDWNAIQAWLAPIPEERYDAPAHFAKGMLLAYGPPERRDVERALSHLEGACRLAPRDPRYLNTLSEAYLQTRQPVRALEVATRAREADPRNPLAAVARGRAAWFSGERPLAFQNFQDALRLLPPQPSPLRGQLVNMTFKLAPFWWEPLQGKRLALVRMEGRHRDFLLACRRDSEFQHHYHLFQEATPEAVERDLRASARPPMEIKRIEWVVEREGTPIGLAALVELDFNNSRTEILIGFPGQEPFGTALEATLLVMEFAFATVGFRKLISYVYGDNPNGQRNTMHLGFDQEGFLKSHVVDPVTKARLDLHVNGCLAETFFANHSLMRLAKRLLGRVPQPGREALAGGFAPQANLPDLLNPNPEAGAP